MEDAQIIRLYFNRDEAAISETAAKYGAFCHGIAINILSIEADAEECVNDTYLRAWNSIPPQQPVRLGVWLGAIVRNLALDLWNKNHRKKRDAGMTLLLSELEDCIPSSATVDREIEGQELTKILNEWLASLSKSDRILFIRRYWMGERIQLLAKESGLSPQSVTKRMYRLRKNLKSILEREGYSL